jgi:hypothetical protein
MPARPGLGGPAAPQAEAQRLFLPLSLWGDLPSTPPPVACQSFARPCKGQALPRPLLPQAGDDAAVPQWFYLVNGFSQDTDPPQLLVLTDQNNDVSSGASLVLAPLYESDPDAQTITTDGRGQVWQVVSADAGGVYLVNGVGHDLVLSLSWPSSGSCPTEASPALLYPNQTLTGSPLTGTAQMAFQTWSATEAETLTIAGNTVPMITLQNGWCGSSLYASSSASGSAVMIGTDGGPGKLWTVWPNYPLDAILNEPAVPFPTGTGDEVTAYTYINSQLGPQVADSQCKLDGYSYAGLRCAYSDLNLSDELPSYQAQIKNLQQGPPPAGVSASSWYSVTQQLYVELGDATIVQALYSNLNTAFTDLFTESDSELNGLINDALGSTSATNQVSGTAAALAKGVTFTILSALGPVSSVAANLLQTALNTTNAANQGNLTSTFSVAADDLWTTLSEDYKTVLDTLGDQEAAVLQDWGMMQQVAYLATITGPDSLYWTATTDAAFTEQGAGGYAVAAMQMLLPVKFGVYRLTAQANDSPLTSDTNNGAFNNPAPAAWNQYSLFLGTEPGTSYEHWDQYYIAEQSDYDSYPTQAAIQTDVLDNGGVAGDLFTASNGWAGLPINDYYLACDGLITRITNWTGNPLTVQAYAGKGDGAIGGQGSSLYSTPTGDVYGARETTVTQNLAPFGTVSVAGLYDSNLLFDIQIFDATYSTTDSVASYDTQQHSCGGTDKTWVSNENYIGGYSFWNFAVTTQSDRNPGLITVGIWK